MCVSAVHQSSHGQISQWLLPPRGRSYSGVISFLWCYFIPKCTSFSFVYTLFQMSRETTCVCSAPLLLLLLQDPRTKRKVHSCGIIQAIVSCSKGTVKWGPSHVSENTGQQLEGVTSDKLEKLVEFGPATRWFSTTRPRLLRNTCGAGPNENAQLAVQIIYF